uniref:NADH dehydrogenase [ubiquinone] 1 beta subcomplex subunit 6 n=1 Tax=Sphenodon punctatus TaxID=8508 RepID=A0A8D0G526_SPHPU
MAGGYTPDEKLRLEQVRALRRRWLKDQELSPREPVLLRKPGLVEGFWERFLQPGGLWRRQIHKLYKASVVTVAVIIPVWVLHYYMKYHVEKKPYGVVAVKRRLYPGDTILETGEVIPPMEIPSSHD